MIGHNVTSCTWLKPKTVVDRGKKPTNARKQMTLKYVEKQNPDGLGL